MTKKFKLNQEVKEELKEYGIAAFWIIVAVAVMGVPITYLIYRPFIL
jgi:hypothetical protein